MSVLGWDGLPRISEFIRRWSGQEEIVPPGLVIQSDRPEWLFLQGIRLWSTGAIQVAAAAGNRSKVEIPNLSTNLMIVVTSAVVLNPQGAGQYTLTIDGPAQGTPTQNFSRDTRQGVAVQSINRIGNAAGGVGGTQIEEVFTTLGVDRRFDGGSLPAIITPGHNLQLWNTVVNQLIRCMFTGYEYNVRAEEFAP